MEKKHRWSMKYKRSINCSRPKGFSQKQYCRYGRKTSKRTNRIQIYKIHRPQGSSL